MLIIFDLDGVLIESKDMHFNTLNLALENVHKDYVIDYNDHLENYNGFPTKKKLELLTKKKGLPIHFYEKIQKEKQNSTIEWIKKIPVDNRLRDVFSKLKNEKNKISVASNSISDTVKTALLSLQLMEFIDCYVSNEDVLRPKPFPEIYWKCMIRLNFLPTETIILEDSPIGRLGAINSGAYLIPIDSPSNVTIELIQQKIKEINS